MTKQITSAFGEAKYPHLNQPDTEFNSDGIFQVKLLVNKEDAQKDIKIIDDVIKEQLIIEGKKQPNKTDKFKRAPLPYKEMEDGRIQFHFKTKFKSYSLFELSFNSLDKLHTFKGDFANYNNYSN